MKIRNLEECFDFNFNLFGIVSADKDYKLAWQINHHFTISLSRNKDYIVELAKGNGEFVNFQFTTASSELRLFKNRGVATQQDTRVFLVPEMKHFDYFILVKGNVQKYGTKEVVDTMKKIPSVLLINPIDLNSLRSKVHFIIDS